MAGQKAKQIVNKFFSDKNVLLHYKGLNLKPEDRSLFEKVLIKKGKVLDLMCGAGRASIYLAKRGFGVLGIDINPKMLEIARSKAGNLRNVRFVQKDAAKFSKPNGFDYALIMENSLEHIHSEKDRMKVLANAYKSLKKGGKFIINFHSALYPFFWPILFLSRLENIFNKDLEKGDYILKLHTFKGIKLFYHFYSYWEVREILEKVGFRKCECISVNELNPLHRRLFRNQKIYSHLRPLLYCYWVCTK